MAKVAHWSDVGVVTGQGEEGHSAPAQLNSKHLDVQSLHIARL